MRVWDWDSDAPNMDLGRMVAKSIYSPLAIFSLILVGIGGKVGWNSSGVDCELRGLT